MRFAGKPAKLLSYSRAGVALLGLIVWSLQMAGSAIPGGETRAGDPGSSRARHARRRQHDDVEPPLQGGRHAAERAIAVLGRCSDVMGVARRAVAAHGPEDARAASVGVGEQCLDGRTDVKCTDYGDWTQAWTEIKG